MPAAAVMVQRNSCWRAVPARLVMAQLTIAPGATFWQGSKLVSDIEKTPL